jgi:predicted DNA-binding transcriptional regulator AlpA
MANRHVMEQKMVNREASSLMNEFAAASLIGMSVSFLRAGRSRGILGAGTPPPPHRKIGKTVRYSREELTAWLDERRVDPSDRRRAATA